jgi:predicted amidohydrolase YtcJ
MVLLSDDIFSMPPEKIRDAYVLKTIVGGKIVWDRETAPREKP